MSVVGEGETRFAEKTRLPMAGLLALFTAGFLGIINETIPAGLLPEMADSLGRSESVVGQTITVYALATALTAIPLNAALKNMSRRKVLVSALIDFALANAVAALVDGFVMLLIARFVAGVGAGLIWSNIGGYAARIVPEGMQGKAVAIALAGTPVALSLGLPAGTLLGNVVGWQATFGVVAILSLALIPWVLISLPDIPGATSDGHVLVATALRAPGVRSILWVVAGFISVHNLLYTYIGPLTVAAGVGSQIEWVLLVFGVAALLSLWGTGRYLDPHHRRLTIMSTVILGGSAAVLGLVWLNPLVLYLGVAAWGLGFGGSATLFLTAGMRAAETDGIQAVVVTVFNISIAAGGVFGGILLAGAGVMAIPWVAVAIMIPTMVATVAGKRHAFPPWS